MANDYWDWVDPSGGGSTTGTTDQGGGSGGRPVSTLDARAIEYARILDLVSEGPIVGLVDGLKSVFLDDTPVMNADGSLNFDGLILQAVSGTGTQAPIPGFIETETETSVNTKVSISGGPVTRTISTPGISAVRVKIKIPALKTINTTTGKEYGGVVEYKVEIQSASYNGGAWTQVQLDGTDYKGKVRDQFGTPYTRSYRIPLPAAGPWQVRVTRMTDDAPDAYTQNETWWDSYTELTDARLCYPYSALFAVEVDSQQFRSIPRRSYEIKGRIVKVPVNYDPDTRAYTGIWNGTFKDAWTDNPAWVFYDLASHTRYGAGNYLDASLIDKWTLYQCAQYCDELVDNGRGGTEPRFTCNLYIQTQEEAIRVLTNLLGIFRAMAYEAGGTIVPVQDAPSDPVAIFTNSNVRDGAFAYSGTSRRQRHTAAIVGWNDPNDGYRLVPEVVEDQAGIARYGYQPIEITALGCTSQGQARRYGLWALASEMTETESVSFSAALEGAAVAPGEVIQINDQHRAGFSRWGGRIVSATTTAVTLDAPVTLGAGSYTLKCTLPDGTVESRTVSTGAGTHSTLTVGTAFSQAPGAEAQWLLQDAAVTPRYYRVVSIGEGDGLEHEILAVEHNPAKYAAVESGLTLGPGVSGGPRAFPAVTGLTLTNSLELRFGARIQHLEAKWNPTTNATGYRAVASRDNGPWQVMEVSAATARLWGAEEGSYRVRVVAVYPTGSSTFVEASTTVSEATSIPGGIAADDLTNVDSTAFQTSDYAEDAYGNPTAGAWLGVGAAQPMKCGPNGLKIGKGVFNQQSLITERVANGFFWKSAEGWGLTGTNAPVWSDTNPHTTGCGNAASTNTGNVPASNVGDVTTTGSVSQVLRLGVPDPNATAQNLTLWLRSEYAISGSGAALQGIAGYAKVYLTNLGSGGAETLIGTLSITTADTWTQGTFDLDTVYVGAGAYGLRVEISTTATVSAGAVTAQVTSRARLADVKFTA